MVVRGITGRKEGASRRLATLKKVLPAVKRLECVHDGMFGIFPYRFTRRRINSTYGALLVST